MENFLIAVESVAAVLTAISTAFIGIFMYRLQSNISKKQESRDLRELRLSIRGKYASSLTEISKNLRVITRSLSSKAFSASSQAQIVFDQFDCGPHEARFLRHIVGDVTDRVWESIIHSMPGWRGISLMRELHYLETLFDKDEVVNGTPSYFDGRIFGINDSLDQLKEIHGRIQRDVEPELFSNIRLQLKEFFDFADSVSPKLESIAEEAERIIAENGREDLEFAGDLWILEKIIGDIDRINSLRLCFVKTLGDHRVHNGVGFALYYISVVKIIGVVDRWGESNHNQEEKNSAVLSIISKE